MSIRAGVVVAVAFHEVNAAPNAKSCAKRDYQSLQYVNCAVEKIHIIGGCVLVGQIYFVYVKGFVGLYDCSAWIF